MPDQPHKEIGSNILILFTTRMLALCSSSFISALALLLSHYAFYLWCVKRVMENTELWSIEAAAPGTI